jgi:transposase-like protein
MVKISTDYWRRLAKSLVKYINKAEVSVPTCKFCGSTLVVRNGTRKGVQYWLCKKCGHGFVDNKAVVGGRYPIDTVASDLPPENSYTMT